MDDCIRKFKKINLEGIEGITKENKNLYKDSLRLINEIDSNLSLKQIKEKLEYNAK